MKCAREKEREREMLKLTDSFFVCLHFKIAALTCLFLLFFLLDFVF